MTSPPSAAGHLEPYGVHIRLHPGSAPLGAAAFLRALLEMVAASCLDAGATVVGHLKCALHVEGGPVACNLTTVRSGAVCRGDEGTTIAAGEDAVLDLAVLVYDLNAQAIDRLVGEALDALLGPAGVHWSRIGAIRSQHT